MFDKRKTLQHQYNKKTQSEKNSKHELLSTSNGRLLALITKSARMISKNKKK